MFHAYGYTESKSQTKSSMSLTLSEGWVWVKSKSKSSLSLSWAQVWIKVEPESELSLSLNQAWVWFWVKSKSESESCIVVAHGAEQSQGEPRLSSSPHRAELRVYWLSLSWVQAWVFSHTTSQAEWLSLVTVVSLWLVGCLCVNSHTKFWKFHQISKFPKWQHVWHHFEQLWFFDPGPAPPPLQMR